MIETRHTYCRVCEPTCGLLATVDDGRIVKLEPDRDHPGTKGFACPRGLATLDIHHDPDRLDHPLRRGADGSLARVSWGEALAAIAEELKRLRDRHGPEAIAVYVGNPPAFNSALGFGIPRPLAEFGVTRRFYAGTQDCANKFAGSAAVFGSPALHPIPDIERADVILLIGSNWRSSKASFMSLPNPYGALMAARRRGATIWFVNPRRTESSTDLTGPTVQIRPDTDVYFIAALICHVERTVGFHPDTDGHGTNVDGLRSFVRRFPPERVAGVCGVRQEAIEEIADTFAVARAAAVHVSTGVNLGRQGTLAYWLTHMLSLVTGNLDRLGGNVVGASLYPVPARPHEVVETEFGQMRAGEPPGGLLPEYITDAESPVRALVVIGGNPLLSIPGEAALRDALSRLELLVCVDIYPTATSEYAHWLLPATDMLERPDCTIAAGTQLRSWVQWTDAVVDPAHERWPEWKIFAALGQHLGTSSALDQPDVDAAVWGKIDRTLGRVGLSRAALRDLPGGVKVIAEEPPTGHFYDELVATVDHRVDCCPPSLQAVFDDCEQLFAELEAEPPGQMKLISGRHSRMQNSWFANVKGMKSGSRRTNRLGIAPADAQRLAIEGGSLVNVLSAWGEIVVEATLDDSLRDGVVWLEHGWGAQPSLSLSRRLPGVNVNAVLPHGPGSFEPLSSQQQLTGVAVEVIAHQDGRVLHAAGEPA